MAKILPFTKRTPPAPSRIRLPKLKITDTPTGIRIDVEKP